MCPRRKQRETRKPKNKQAIRQTSNMPKKTKTNATKKGDRLNRRIGKAKKGKYDDDIAAIVEAMPRTVSVESKVSYVSSTRKETILGPSGNLNAQLKDAGLETGTASLKKFLVENGVPESKVKTFSTVVVKKNALKLALLNNDLVDKGLPTEPDDLREFLTSKNIRVPTSVLELRRAVLGVSKATA